MKQLINRIHYSFFVTFFLIMGIWYQAAEYPIWIPVLIFLSTISILFFKKATHLILPFVLLSAIYGLGSIRYKKQQTNFNNFYKLTHQEKFDVIGTVTAIDLAANAKFSKRVTLDLSKIKKTDSKEKWQQIDNTVYIYTYTTKYLDVADFIILKNITFKKSNNNSFNNYLIKEKKVATLFLTPFDYRRLYRPYFSFYRWLSHAKKSLFFRLRKKFSRETFTFFSTLFLASPSEKQQINDVKHAFKSWGIIHYLARSGLHLVLFILIFQFLLQFLPISYTKKQLLLVVITLAYALLSWSSIPFTRALYTFFLYKIGAFLHFKTHLLHLLALICFITLIVNPMQLFFLDFQLSFGLTTGLAYFNLIWD